MPCNQCEAAPGRLRFDEIRVGDEADLVHVLTQEDVEGFAGLTGDRNPLHTDEAFAQRTAFRKPIVHGMLSASFISTMIGMVLPGQGALWTSQTLEFRQPAYVGDRLQIVARVKQKSPATRMLVLDVTIKNQHGQTLVDGESRVKMLEVEDEEKTVTGDATRVVLVTGGSRGIGAAVARKLASEGHQVIVNYLHSATDAQAVVDDIVQQGGRALALQADVVHADEITTLFSKAEKAFGPVRGVVHCAAADSAVRPFESLEWAAVQEQLDVQLRGAFNCAQAALPAMVEAQSGCLIFLGSIAADGVPPGQQADYVIAKAALGALARSLAVEYGPKGVAANIVAPGMTRTDRILHLPDRAKMLTRMQTPLRRLAEPEDVAGVVAFLLSPGARHITGETIRVCGGAVMV